jgi:hypothetical protein
MEEQPRSNQRPQATNFEIELISRGNGRGHAVPDMAIAHELTRLAPHIQIDFVSYATGAETYRACGYPVTDVGAPEMPPFLDMIVALTRLFGQMEPAPRLIVSHEEIPAVVAAEILGIPCVFITDFFMDPSSMFMQALQYASEIIFTAERGLYTEPPQLRGKVQYVGRAVRPFQYCLADRDRARAELGIPPNATVILLQPGTWVESRAPVADLIMDTWKLIPRSPKRLIWLAGRDYDSLHSRFSDQPDLILLREDWKIDRLMAASNVLITKANRLTVYEAAALGLPSISLSNGANWPDDVAVANVDSNTPLVADSVTPQLLMETIMQSIAANPSPATEVSAGVAGAAARLARHVEEILLQDQPGSAEANA